MLEGEHWGGSPSLALQADATDTPIHSPQLPSLPALAQRDISRVWGLPAMYSGCFSCGTFHLHKSTLKTVPSSPSFSCLNLQRCYLTQEATSHPVCLKETLHDCRVSETQPKKKLSFPERSRERLLFTGEKPSAFGEKEGKKTTPPSSLPGTRGRAEFTVTLTAED